MTFNVCTIAEATPRYNTPSVVTMITIHIYSYYVSKPSGVIIQLLEPFLFRPCFTAVLVFGFLT